MGIRHLNRLLKTNAPSAMTACTLEACRGKVIVIDIQIYLYKYTSEGTLLENMYLLLELCTLYDITPIFIFDGKPAANKQEVLDQRKIDRAVAEKEYHSLRTLYESTNSAGMSEQERSDMEHMLQKLKQSFIKLNKHDVAKVKELIHCHGSAYMDAPGEADELCAALTISGQAWACMSEDMDMFVYGCPRVIRYVNLLTHKIVVYDTAVILQSMQMSQHELRVLCALSGTDYNSKNGHSIFDVYSLFQQYRCTSRSVGTNFQEWLAINAPEYVSGSISTQSIVELFDVTPMLTTILSSGLNEKNRSRYEAILREDGFIFV